MISIAQLAFMPADITLVDVEKDRAEARDISWDRKGPLPDIGGQRKVSDRGGFGSGRGSGGYESASDAGGDRGSRRPPYEQGDGKVRDFGNWDRKGPLTPTLPTGPAARSFDRPDRPVSRDGPGRRNSPSWGEGRPAGSDAGSRPPRREFVDRPPIERAPTAAEQDNQWRSKMKPDAPPAAPAQPVSATRSPALSHRELSTPPSPAGPPAALAAPASRPKLNLAKRTVSEAPSDAASTPAADSKASPFGAAKPIDTATREKEVEEKRQIAIREKKEADEKARADRKEADDKAREERKTAKETEIAARNDKAAASKEKSNGQVSPKEKPNGQVPKEKENGAAVPPAGKNYEILRRTANDDASAADEEADEAAEVDGLPIDDKAIKPKEIVRDISTKNEEATKTNGNPTSTDPTADALENDGWSTVPDKNKKRNKSGNQAARAIAS